jgi:hypothetical protein
MSSNEIRQVEQSLTQAKQLLAMGESLQRLYSNRDFKKVILEGYFEKEAVRLVHLKSDAAMTSQVHQENIIKQLDGIGALVQYFQTINQLASIATNSIASDEQTLSELLEEEANV